MAQTKSKVLHIIGNRVFRYIYKNPQKNMLKLIKIGKAVAGKMYPESTFTKPIEIISDESNIWHSFLFRGQHGNHRTFFMITSAISIVPALPVY